MAYILGIESSCDETAAAIFDTQHTKIIANALFTQIEMHKLYGGVVPEIASRAHIEQIGPVVHQALMQAGLQITDIDAIAVVNKPGLAGSLLVGFTYAKSLAWAQNIPLITVNHLEGHIFSSFIGADDKQRTDIPFPHLCLSVSGGHSGIYLVTGLGEYKELGNTRDDAAGEAFDKTAKLIGLGYPGGPIIEKLATEANFKDFYSYPRTKHTPGQYMFSFSGLKTAVMYDLIKRGHYNLDTKTITPTLTATVQKEVASSLLVCIGDIFAKMIQRICNDIPEIRAVTFVGGVASNAFLRKKLCLTAQRLGRPFFHSEKKYSTDNGAMVALVGAYKYTNKQFSSLSCDIFE